MLRSYSTTDSTDIDVTACMSDVLAECGRKDRNYSNGNTRAGLFAIFLFGGVSI